MNINHLINKIKSNGYKVTQQRKTILEVLYANEDSLISAESICHQSKAIYDKTNMSTVYRNLKILEELDMIYKVNIDSDTTLYKLVCCEEQHHHHIICKKCGKTEIIDFCPLDKLKSLSEDKNFILTDHKIELYGYCEDCKGESLKQNNPIDK
jgi:Fe2+ or Zn2+ uptake regulation protein